MFIISPSTSVGPRDGCSAADRRRQGFTTALKAVFYIDEGIRAVQLIFHETHGALAQLRPLPGAIVIGPHDGPRALRARTLSPTLKVLNLL
ncbi:hypothetical protein EVAR_44507_1 [Eumeta japonica]|uniref:Uncharacterized protein n=1 Tax=Eumeta variegata TaxID=151549 RepID=A0A4C1WJV1_EUMVA|nr:hypothetical protein EVAR_44507_1 [Eumeta japonica]